jgi:uncharacterized damage-inducible protein DinB
MELAEAWTKKTDDYNHVISLTAKIAGVLQNGFMNSKTPASFFKTFQNIARFLRYAHHMPFRFEKTFVMKEHIIADFEKARLYTIAVAEAMPDEQYDYKPVKNVRTFTELIHHLAYSLIWMEENYVRQLKTEWEPPAPPEKKENLLKYLNEGFDVLGKSVQIKNQWDEAEIKNFYFIIEHNAHHRGQAVTYLRCCNTIPPEFPF